MTETLLPEHLRAGAALWSARAALALLRQRADDEARAIADERAAAADPVKSPIYGARRALGGHSDPTSEALIALKEPLRGNRFADLAAEVEGQLNAVAQHLPTSVRRDGAWVVCVDSLDRIEAALPAMTKAMAVATWTLLDVKVDARVRRLLSEPFDRRFVPRVRCPWCDAVSLMMRMAPPKELRVVECTTCDGAWTWTEMAGRAA